MDARSHAILGVAVLATVLAGLPPVPVIGAAAADGTANAEAAAERRYRIHVEGMT